MHNQTVLGVDIGTQGTKAALFSESGKCLVTAFRKSRLIQPREGVVEEDPEFQVTTVCQVIRACVVQRQIEPKSVAAIAIGGQMAGILGVGQDGMQVTPYDSWLDTRCAAYITRMSTSAGEEIVMKTGGPVSFNHGPKILWWMHERPKNFRAIRAFVQPGGYAAMRLCGLTAREAFIDKTYLHFSGFADNQKGCWDVALCARFSLDPARLPRIVNSHEVVGELIGSMARRCGLRAGVPVVAGCGDTAASFLAAGATREGICVDVAGTASVFAATTRTFCPDSQYKTLSCGQAATPGLWHPYAYINGGGMNLEWFRRQLATAGLKSAAGVEFGRMDREASRISPSDELPLFVPHLGGRVSPSRPHLRGAWAGLSWSHSTAHLWRAVLEAVALEYGVYRQVLLSLYPRMPLTEIRVVGGGERSGLWNQIKADTLGSRVVQINRGEGAPLGTALLAAYGVGLLKNMNKAAGQWIGIGKVTRPNRQVSHYYQRRLSRYVALLDALNGWSET